MHARTQASNRLARTNRASHGPRVRAKERVKRTSENPKSIKGTKGAKGSHKGKTSKTGLLGLENSKSEKSSETQESAHTRHADNSWIHDGWKYDEWNDDWSSTSVGNKRMTIPQAHFHKEVLDVRAASSLMRFDWVKMNLDTGAAVNTFPLNFGPNGAGDGRFY